MTTPEGPQVPPKGTGASRSGEPVSYTHLDVYKRQRRLSLEQSLEFCREDECVEVTPEAVRIRKVVLDQIERARTAARARAAAKSDG